MPIYEYECRQCKKTIEVLQKFTDPSMTECEQCGGRLRKLMSLNSFHLKGSGWYVTDYTGKKADSSSVGGDKKSSESKKE